MDFRGKTIVPRFAWINGEVLENTPISIDSKGLIENIGDMKADAVKLENEIFLPGFVNSHSHAFHRQMRGRSEIGGKGAETFWKWRDNMYGIVQNIEYKELYEYCLSTFREMLSAGISTVGEFHYVHHSTGRFDLDGAVIDAAEECGIRITLIQTLYERAGFDGGELHPVQKNFTSNYEEFIENLEKLLKRKSDTVTIAVAAHSARAVPFENICRLYEFAKERDMAFHIHLEEQPKEIIDCRNHLNEDKSPSDVLIDQLELEHHFTAVHATFTSVENMKHFGRMEANVSICPCTEGYLGDGIPFVFDGLPISFGTDCNNRINMLEEMRWACYTQQMKCNTRSVAALTAARLLEAATMGGAKSLNISRTVGTFEVGKVFDAVSIDLAAPSLANIQKDTVVDAIVFGCGNREICRTIVAGISRFEKE